MGFRRQQRPRAMHAWAPTFDQGRRDLAAQGWWQIPPEVVEACQRCLDEQVQLRTRQMASRALREGAASIGLVLDTETWIVSDPEWRPKPPTHPKLV